MSVAVLAQRHGPPDGGSDLAGARPVVLVVGVGGDSAEETRASLERAGCDAMVCCSPQLALNWLLDHEGFFSCLIIEPEKVAAPDTGDLIEDAREAGLDIPILMRTVFPSARPMDGTSWLRDETRSIFSIPLGYSALHAWLRRHVPGLPSHHHPRPVEERG